MSASFTEYYLQLFDTRLRSPIADNTGVFLVLTAGTPVYASAFSDPLGTSSLTQPGTMTGGVIRFFVASSVSSVDLVVLSANGHAKYLRGVTPSMGRIDIDPETLEQKLYLPFTFSASNVSLSTGFSLSQSMRVKDAYVRISTADTTATLNVGTTTAGLAAFVLGAIATVTGYRLVNEFTSGAEVWGSALSQTATNCFTRLYHRAANATSALPIQLTTAATAGATSTATGNGFVVLVYDRLPAA